MAAGAVERRRHRRARGLPGADGLQPGSRARPAEEDTKKIAWPPASTEKTEALPSHEPATEHIEKPKTDD